MIVSLLMLSRSTLHRKTVRGGGIRCVGTRLFPGMSLDRCIMGADETFFSQCRVRVVNRTAITAKRLTGKGTMGPRPHSGVSPLFWSEYRRLSQEIGLRDRLPVTCGTAPSCLGNGQVLRLIHLQRLLFWSNDRGTYSEPNVRGTRHETMELRLGIGHTHG